MADYPAILTTLGLQAVADAIADGTMVAITHVAVGDGNGIYRDPDPAHTALAHEVYRAAPNSIVVNPSNPAQVLVTLVIPADQGGWTVREIGIFDGDGHMLGEGKVPATTKPLPEGGGGGTLSLNFPIGGSAAPIVTILIDPATVLATRDHVADRVHNHRHSGLPDGGILDYAIDTGSANAYAIALTHPLVAQVTGMPIWFLPGRDNTGASTIAIGALAAADIKYRGASLMPGHLRANLPACVIWTGVHFELLNPCRPAGQIVWHPGTIAAPRTLKLIGSTPLRADYAALWAFAQAYSSVVSEAAWAAGSWGCFSVGDGAATFRLPDLRGEFLRGLDDGRGVDAGRGLGVAQADEFKLHNHPMTGGSEIWIDNQSPNWIITAGGGTVNMLHQPPSYTGGTETRPRNIAYLPCITY